MKRIISFLAALIAVMLLTASAETSHDIALKQAEQCAFSAEYGGDVGYVRKWSGEIRVYITGSYNYSDAGFFYDFIKQLSDNVPGLPAIKLVDSEADANVRMYFVRLSEMGSVIPNYVSGNWGYFYYYYRNGGEIYTADIAIAWDKCDQDARRHLMMEEFVGALGLANDHYIDSGSILYQKWTTTQSLTAADWNMIRMVYDSRITIGMKQSEALSIMRNIY